MSHGKIQEPCVACGDLTRDHYNRSPVTGVRVRGVYWCAQCFERLSARSQREQYGSARASHDDD